MEYVLRPYQQTAVNAAVKYLKGPYTTNGLMVCPTGSGKSLIIANIIKELGEPVLVFQPSKEILEQNHAKYESYGFGAGIFSASVGRKQIYPTTFATIGSVKGHPEAFKQFRYIIIDECFPAGHLVDGVPIEKIKTGDYVSSFNHDTGRVEAREVTRTFKKQIHGDLVEIKTEDGEAICCTEYHPVWVCGHGYLPAILLASLWINREHEGGNNEQEEDLFLSGLRERMQAQKSRQNEHLLQQGMCRDIEGKSTSSGGDMLCRMRETDCHRGNNPDELQQNGEGLLLSNMRQYGTETIFGGQCGKTKRRPGLSQTAFGADEKEQSHVDSGNQRKDDCIYEGQAVPPSWRQWADHATTRGIACCHGAANGTRDIAGGSQGSIQESAEIIQGGFSGALCQTCNRSGRERPSSSYQQIARLKEDGNIECVWVASVTVHKRGSGQRFEQLCPDNYVYNLEVEGNSNYFVNGILVHNCHGVNPKQGMYRDFLKALGSIRVLGLTATPYRLVTDGFGGSILKFLTRTRPRVFTDLVYYVNNKVLFDAGYLAKIRYVNTNGFDRAQLRMNTTGADFDDRSVQNYYQKTGFQDKVLATASTILQERRNVLVFTRFISEAEYLVSKIPGSAIVTAETSKRDRENIIAGFRSGAIRAVANVGVLTTGFDYPELEAVILARPTMSLALYYQMIGRGIRIHPNKSDTLVVDMCGNLSTFGPIEDLKIVDGGFGKWYVANGKKQLTNVYFGRGS